MARVTSIVRIQKSLPKAHEPTKCEGTWFEIDGERIVQLDTFGSTQRKERGQISQSLQFDAAAVRQLRALLDEAFPR